jgi:two-component system, cell cycle sensor histidine kinase and response regulator CckA
MGESLHGLGRCGCRNNETSAHWYPLRPRCVTLPQSAPGPRHRKRHDLDHAGVRYRQTDVSRRRATAQPASRVLFAVWVRRRSRFFARSFAPRPVLTTYDSQTSLSPLSVRRHTGLMIASVTYAVLYAAWILAHYGENTRRVEDLGFLPLYLAAGLSVWMGAPAPGAEWRERTGWQLIGGAWILSCVAAIGWAAGSASATVDVIADALYTAYYPMLVAGFALLSAMPRTERSRFRLLLETLIVLVACLTFAWYFVNEGTTRLSRLERFIGVGELTSFGEIWVLVAASVALHGRPTASRRPALQLLALGAFVAAIGDLMLGYLDPALQHAHRQLAVIFLAAAAAIFTTAGATNVLPDRPGRLDTGAWLPYTAITLVGALLTREILRPVPEFRLLSGLVLGGVLLTAFVLLRLLLAERAVREEHDARKAQDARYRALIQRSREALLVVGPDGVLRYASAAAEPILGWDAERAVGRRLVDLLADGAASPLATALESPVDGRVVHWQLATDRGTREIESVISDLRDDAAVQGLVLNTRDVTERCAIEARLRQSQKLDALGLLAGGVAHDFNNILTVIRGTSELVVKFDRAHPLDEMKQIQLASDRGAALCRQLLAFGRVDVVRRELLDLGGLTRGVLPMLQRVVPSTVRLEMQHTGAPLTVMCDRAQLEIAVLNLVMNSRDAITDGGTISVRTGTEVVVNNASDANVDGIPAGRFASIVVRDSGAGMDEKTLARALDPFFTTKPLGAGTGLGLSTVYGVVTAAGGHLRIRSAPGQGTIVTLLFPVADGVIAVPEVPAQRVETAPGSVVLVVDDESALRGAIASYLTGMGYLVHEAGDGVDAIERLEAMTRRPDAVISDITMPRMNGVALARHIREQHADLPIILISGYMASAATRHEFPAKVDLMDKPFAFAELESLLNRRVHQLV